MEQLDLEHVQLGLAGYLNKPASVWQEDLAKLKDAGIVITAGMMHYDGEDYTTIASIRKTGGLVPDEQWPLRKEQTIAGAKLASEMGVNKISFHAGFIPPSSSDAYPILIARLSEVGEAAKEAGVEILLETGQESATNLLQFLNDLSSRNVFANFDPANMILYGAGNPIEAVKILGRHIHHVHIKDATMSDQPGAKWGAEVPFGQGTVGAQQFCAALKQIAYTGPLVFEREAGGDRIADLKTGIAALRAALM
jgi:L-ribulose-5-phosphate 3-epimerase